MPYNWGIPVDIPEPPGADGPIPSWQDLKFNPIGLFNLRRRLGVLSRQPGVFARYQQRFLASDIAWFAAGSSADGNHRTAPDTFHNQFSTVRYNLPSGAVGLRLRKELQTDVQRLTFDLATLWDRSFGGCTMILHVDGTTAPGTPVLPQFIKAHVYLPPPLIEEFPESHQPISSIVQSFIENLGIPTIRRWARAGRNRGWTLDQPRHIHEPTPIAHAPVPPPIDPASSHYIFHGRPYCLQTAPEEDAAPRVPSPNSDQCDLELDTTTHRLLDAFEEIATLKTTIDTMVKRESQQQAEFAQREGDYEATASSLRMEIKGLIVRLRTQEIEIAALRSGNMFHSDTSSLSPTFPTPDRSHIPSFTGTPPKNKKRSELPTFSVPTRLLFMEKSASPSAFPEFPAPQTYLRSPSHQEPSQSSPSRRHAGTGCISQSMPVLGPATEEFIQANGLDSMSDTFALIVRHVPVPQWDKEVRNIVSMEDLATGLIDAMTSDWKLVVGCA